MKTLLLVIKIIINILAILTSYKIVFIIIGLLVKPKKYKEVNEKKSFGILIPARNEEKVIQNLINSIHEANYPQELIHIYVLCNNCTDQTYQIVKDIPGVFAYDIHDKEIVTKGYALRKLINNLKEDNLFFKQDYFVIFDSDNIVDKEYFNKMNEAMINDNLDSCNGYRNSKNFKTNVISSGYSIHWFYNNLHAHRPRNYLNMSTHVTGTGYTLKRELLNDGWNYLDLTEDASISLDMISEGKKVGFCEEAVIYDEQPTDFKTTIKQRLRWKRGTYYSFFSRLKKICKGMFTNKTFTQRFSCYDALFTFMPFDILSMILTLTSFIIGFILSIINENVSVLPIVFTVLKALVTTYIGSLFMGLLAIIKERKNIYCDKKHLILYLFAYPWYDLISLPLSVIAILLKVKWEPIEHKDKSNLKDIKEAK